MNKDETLFNFIPDQSFRQILQNDYDELHKCLEYSCNKSAMVLSGSIIESVALYCVQALNIWSSAKRDVLSGSLSELIHELHKHAIIDDKIKDLSSVLREYRNLIHPGKLIRLNEHVDINSAEISASLVNLITAKISSAFSRKYGLTADQLIEKLKIDHSASNLATHYLKHMNSNEVIRLIVKLIPNEISSVYMLYNSGETISSKHQLYIRCLRSVFSSVMAYRSDTNCEDAFGTFYIDSLKNGSSLFISLLDINLYSGQNLLNMPDEDYEFIKDHWLLRISSENFSQYNRGIKRVLSKMKISDKAKSFRLLVSCYKKEKEDKMKKDVKDAIMCSFPYKEEELKSFISSIRETYFFKQNEAFIEEMIKEAELLSLW